MPPALAAKNERHQISLSLTMQMKRISSEAGSAAKARGAQKLAHRERHYCGGLRCGRARKSGLCRISCRPSSHVDSKARQQQRIVQLAEAQRHLGRLHDHRRCQTHAHTDLKSRGALSSILWGVNALRQLKTRYHALPHERPDG